MQSNMVQFDVWSNLYTKATRSMFVCMHVAYLPDLAKKKLSSLSCQGWGRFLAKKNWIFEKKIRGFFAVNFE